MTRKTSTPANSAGVTPPWRAPLIATKMGPPHTRGRIPRSGAIELLRAGLKRKLTVVTAPAGYGKTTLLTEWLDLLLHEGHAAAWLSLDRDDEQLSQFVAYFLSVVQQACRGLGARAQQMLEDDPLAPIKMILTELINEIGMSDLDVVVVLDDFDRMNGGPVCEIVFWLLRYAPDNLHLVLAGRAVPAIPLSYFSSRDQLTSLSMEDLRFDTREAKAFFAEVAGKPLKASDLDTLLVATEGWVSGLQLASLSLRDDTGADDIAQRLPAARSDIGRYLHENVLIHTPGAIREFLLSTSVLDRLTPSLCNALTGANDAAASLDWLLTHNMFIKPLDANRDWFRYHSLLSEYLRAELTRRSPGRAVDLHRRASRWFAEMGLWSEAVKHALEAGDVDQAVSWVEQGAMALIERSDVRTVLAWISKLPAAAVQKQLRLRLAHAWVLALTMDAVQAKQALDDIESDIERGILSIVDNPAIELLAVRSLIAGLTDRSPDSLTLGRRVLDAAPARGSWVEQIGQTTLIFGLSYAFGFDEIRRLRAASEQSSRADEPLFAAVYRQCMSGLSEFVEGRLHEAASTCEAALNQAEEKVGRQLAAAVLPAGYLSAIYYEWNDIERVRRVQGDRFPLALEACSLGPLLRYTTTAVRMAVLDGEVSRAHAILERVDRVAQNRRWLRLQVACMAETIRLNLGAGNLTRANRVGQALEALMADPVPEAPGSFAETWQHFQSARCRLLVARERAAEAVPILQSTRSGLASRGMRYMAAQHDVLLALACERCGQQDEALTALAAALQYGQHNGVIRSFADEGAPMSALLSRFALNTAAFPAVEAWYVEALLRAISATEVAPNTSSTVDERGSIEALAASNLSAREVEILDYVARGLSNKEIARALRVAPETIKWHLKNIFEKLNVSSRIQAVQSGLAIDLPLARKAAAVSASPVQRHVNTRR